MSDDMSSVWRSQRTADDAPIAALDAEAAAWVLALAEGQLAADDERRFQQWMEASVEHRRRFAELAATWHWSMEPGLVVALSVPRLREATTGLPHSPPTSASPRRKERPSRFGPRRVLGVALAAGLVGLALLPRVPEPSLEPTVIATARSESLDFDLPDGSRISLSGDTRLAYRMDAQGRDLELLQGEAYFDIARDGRPLQVRTRAGTVRVLGTAFNIDLVSSDVAEVSVYEGSIQIDSGAQKVELGVGETAHIEANASPRKSVLNETAPDWREGWFVARDEGLARVLQEASRFSRLPLVLGDPALERIRLSGRIRVADPERVMAMLERAYGLRWQREAEQILLLPAIDQG